jgi:hypothetical protein
MSYEMDLPWLEEEAKKYPITEEDKTLLKDNGWVFLRPYYIEIPDDYDGCFAYGAKSIHKVIAGIKRRMAREQNC